MRLTVTNDASDHANNEERNSLKRARYTDCDFNTKLLRVKRD